MQRQTLLLILFISVALLAGCSGGVSDGGDQTPTFTGTPVPDGETALEYEELEPTLQEAFNQAREGSVSLISGDGWEVPDTYDYTTHDVYHAWPEELSTENQVSYVHRNGTYYRVEFDLTCCIGSGQRLFLEPIDAPTNESSINITSRSGREWEFLRYTIEQGGDATGWQVQAPVERGDILEYEGQYWTVTRFQNVDWARGSMTVEKISG